MEHLDAQKKGNQSIQKDLSGDFVYCEAQGDFTLPDYLPELRKIIRIDATVIPSGKFIGSGKAELAGSVAYNLIYSDAEGKLCATSLSSDYELSVPLPSDHGELYLAVDSMAENTQCRLSGPRKLSLRTSVKSKIHIYSRESVAEIVDDSAPDLQTLECAVCAMVTRCATSGEFSLSDGIAIDGFTTDTLRTNYASADLAVREARIMPDGVLCRGEVIVKCNLSPTEGEPFTVTKKLPFEQIVPTDTERAQNCIAYGRCSYLQCTLSPTPEACELNIELSAELDTECMGNAELYMMSDAYSTEYASYPNYKTETFTQLVGSTMGNYTVDSSRLRTEEEGGIISVIDTKGKAEIMSITQKDKKAVVSGECRIDILTSSQKSEGEGVEYGSSEITFPFKLETDLRVNGDERIDYDPHVSVAMTRARLDGDSIYADAEIFLSLKASKKEQYKLLDSIRFDTEEKRSRPTGQIIATYVEDGDTLFSVAKKYGVDYRALAEQNGIPDTLAATPDAQITLDGMTHLIIS